MNKQYTRLTLVDREQISQGIYAFETFAEIARRLNRHTSTVSNEVWRNVKYSWCYSAPKAQTRANERKRRGGPKKLDDNPTLRNYVYEKLKSEWSPEEIAERLKLEYPGRKDMKISHETIYQHLYCLPRGDLKKELMRGLRQERKMRQPRKYAHQKRQRIQDIISISERPKEVENRIVPGHWEGDLIMGKNRESAIGSLVERTTRLTILVPLKAKDALTTCYSFANVFKYIPEKFKKSLTYDRGIEMSRHKLFTKETNIKVFFADPYSPWQRGTNENTNGLIRQYFPKGTDFNTVSLKILQEAEKRLNSRPRKALGYYTPSEKFYQLVTGKKIALGT